MRIVILCASALLFAHAGQADTPIARHMQHMLTAEGTEWRAPNPGYTEGARAPVSFTLTFELDDSRQYATGQLGGLFADGGRRNFWDIFSFYNPVTGRVTTQQVAGTGGYMAGDAEVQDGSSQILDMFSYGLDGATKLLRHENRFTGPGIHESLVFERGQRGEWELTQTWKWRLMPTTTAPGASPAGD